MYTGLLVPNLHVPNIHVGFLNRFFKQNIGHYMFTKCQNIGFYTFSRDYAVLSNKFLVNYLPSEYFLQQSTLPHTLSGRKSKSGTHVTVWLLFLASSL